MKLIAHIENDFTEKFGIPRQSGLVDEVISTIVFEPEYRNPDSLRGLSDYSHIWLIWSFEGFDNGDNWAPTVRPPRLGGNTRMGVFATRSPNRPNPIGLSCVRLIDVIYSSDKGPLLKVSGADLKNNTYIYDIKPYLPYADSHPDATGGFTNNLLPVSKNVSISEELLSLFPEDKRKAVISLLAQDPRPSYHNDSDRIYGMSFAGFNIRFLVKDDTLFVKEVIPE